MPGCAAAGEQDLARRIVGHPDTVGEGLARERPLLRALPAEPAQTAEQTTQRVDAKALVTVRQNRYSVPVGLVGLRVAATIGAREITIGHAGKVAARHDRLVGRFGVAARLDHYLELLARKPAALVGSLALAQERQRGAWPGAFDELWARIAERYGASEAARQMMEALIDAHAIELKLPTVHRRFRALADEATREQQTPVAYLAALLEAEMAERAERRERRRLIDARFPAIKRLEHFRFADNPNVPQATIAALAEGSWIDDRESIIFIGDSGTGKTMLATALAVCACQQGRRVRFTTLAALANELQEAQSNRELARVVGRYARTELVVLDELGYLALPDGAAELVFQVLSERHERGSLIVTTNLPFGEWAKVSPDPRLAKAVIDRLAHRAHIIDTGSRSWRFRHGLTRTRKQKGA